MIFFFFSFFASIIGVIKAKGSILSHIPFVSLSANSPFSGIISFWPFIVVLVLLLLAVLWYQTIKGIRKRKAGRRQPAAQNTFFLGIITVLVLALLAAPWYLETFSDGEAATSQVTEENRVETLLTVHGMDCGGCESLVNKRVSSLEGVETVEASHTRQEVMVVYDKSRVTLATIAQTIEDSGYTVVME